MMKNAIVSATIVRLVQDHRRGTVVIAVVLVAVLAALLALGVSERSATAQSEPETVGRVTGLTATAEGQSPGTVHLTWNAAENAQVYFVLFVKADDLASGNYAGVQMRAFNETEATIDGLEAGASYHFIARGMRYNISTFKHVWGDDWSSLTTATAAGVASGKAPPPDVSQPMPVEPQTVGVVTGLTAITDGQPPGTVQLTWNAAENAQVYLVLFVKADDLASGNYAGVQMRVFNETEATIDGLEAGASYHFIARGLRYNISTFKDIWGDDWSGLTTAILSAEPKVPLSELEHWDRLERDKPASANQLKALPWVADGIDETESDAAQRLVDLAVWWPDTFNALLQKQWIQDTITRDEGTVIEYSYRITRAYSDEAMRLLVSEVVVALLDMPFLDSVESADALAVWSLYILAHRDVATFLEIMSHPKISDGITDEEAKIVVLLWEANDRNQASLQTLLDGLDGTGGVYKEERTTNLPHSGEVLLAIIRFRDNSNANMDYLERAARNVEEFMEEPLGSKYVAWYFGDAIGGHHAGTHITSEPSHDDVNHPYWQDTPAHIAHEVGHYYWRDSKRWISEGGAEFVSAISEHERIGRPLEPFRTPCAEFQAIKDIVPGGLPHASCDYYLGSQLFLDLYHALGEETFRQRFRNLYLKRLRDDPNDDCEGTRLDICHVEAAFKAGASDDVIARVDEVIDRWYHGIGAEEPQIPGREDLYQPIQPPEHMAYIWWEWNPDQDHFTEMVTDFTIHNDVGDWSDDHGLYFMVSNTSISDVGLYFGLQTDSHAPEPPYRRGKAVIFSRWETDQLSDARWDETNGWYELGKHEGGFLGVRRSYAWGAGDYRIRIAPDGLDTDGEWFGLWITDLATNETTWIGSLKFPLLNGVAQISPSSYSTLEIYGNPPIRPIDIPQWHVSIKRTLGDNVPSVRGLPGYGLTSDSTVRNSEVRYDPEEDAVHLQVGGTTERKTPATGHIDFKPLATLNDLERADRLEPAQANQLNALPWIADGIDYTERETAQTLIDAANHYPDTFSALLQKPWATDHDLTAAESSVIYGIRWTARRDEASALAILDMPFLETLEFDDSLAVLALYRLARYSDDGRFKVLMEHPTLESGITDDLTTLVAAAGTIRVADEVERMLNPGYANIEVHTGQTELTPELKISIVRTHSEPRPETMPELVRIAELLESTMQVPLPKPHMIFVVSDWAVSASSRGISQGKRYDFAYGLREDREDTQRFTREYATDRPMLPSVMIHEIGHDYFGNELKSWLNHTPVKNFEYVYRLDGRDPSDVPEMVLNTIHQRSGCEARNIQHLEEMNPPSSDRTNSLCHHYLGYWMGRELLEAVGQEEYFARMRRLYHRKEELVAEGIDPGIAEIRELFPDQLDIVEHYWSGDVGNPEEQYWGGLASLAGYPMDHTFGFGCCCAGCMPVDA
ncbi:MAG: fibronectin type III domain-containing protein [Chloroflexi bacterium]|nr:fibronectin type III domain-containing protein [Chloroflexota bacterium]